MAVGPDVLRLMNDVRVRLPGATDGAIQLELFNVMDEFFKGTNAWQEDVPIIIPANDPPNTVYFISPSGPSTIERLLWVYQQPDNQPTLRGPQVGAAMSVPGELTLRSQPSAQITIVATVALTVQDPTTRDGYVSFPAWILSKYRSTIVHGLIGNMMSQASKPWTNLQMSVFHMRKFVGGISQARIEVTRNNTYRQQAWRFPGGFVRGSQKGFGGLLPPQ